MVTAVASAIFVPIAFWIFDVLVKVLGGIDTDDMGADLCLIGIVFGSTSLLSIKILSTFQNSTIDKESAEQLVTWVILLLIVSIIIYIFSLILIAPGEREDYPSWINEIRSNNNKVRYTIIAGLMVLAIETFIYVWYLVQIGDTL